MSVPTDLILVFALGLLGVQSLALIYVVIRLIGVADKALARAQGPEPASPPSVPPVAHPPAVIPSPVKPPVGPVPDHPAGEVVLDDKYLAFVRKQEGFTPKAFWDYKQWTNGYGTKALSSTEVIDQAEAEKRLVAEATAATQFIKLHFPNLPVGGEQAMIDFTFNLGEGWANGPLGKLLAEGNYTEAKTHMLEYDHAGGKVLDDLVRRRKAEVEMFDHPL
jgi:GH24 family phage-related lysozyme (muramidase)